MEFRFHDKARRNGCFVVSAAGFDSIPADLGVLYTMQQFRAPAVPSPVTSFLSFQIGDAGMCGKHAQDLRLFERQLHFPFRQHLYPNPCTVGCIKCVMQPSRCQKLIALCTGA